MAAQHRVYFVPGACCHRPYTVYSAFPLLFLKNIEGVNVHATVLGNYKSKPSIDGTHSPGSLASYRIFPFSHRLTLEIYIFERPVGGPNALVY